MLTNRDSATKSWHIFKSKRTSTHRFCDGMDKISVCSSAQRRLALSLKLLETRFLAGKRALVLPKH
jgi:hypothetical protein